MNITNYSKKSSVTGIVPDKIVILTGTSGGTIVKSLQIITDNESCCAQIIRQRRDNYNNYEPYATIKVDLKANDYLILWQGFFVIPAGDRLSFQADSNYCRVVANVVEMTS